MTELDDSIQAINKKINKLVKKRKPLLKQQELVKYRALIEEFNSSPRWQLVSPRLWPAIEVGEYTTVIIIRPDIDDECFDMQGRVVRFDNGEGRGKAIQDDGWTNFTFTNHRGEPHLPANGVEVYIWVRV